jgi:hypothetical protein
MDGEREPVPLLVAGDQSMRTALLALAVLAVAGDAQVAGRASLSGSASYGGIPQYDYYVDSVHGSDSNAGISLAAPLRTISALSLRLASNKSICLVRGSHWREQLTVGTLSNLVIADCGSGAKPDLDASDVISSWAPYSGAIYSAAITTTGSNGWVNVWDNNSYLTCANSTGAMTAGSYYVVGQSCSSDGIAGAASTLYIWPPDSTNPNSNGRTYEYSARAQGLDAISCDHCTFRNITTRKNFNNDGSARFGRYAVADGTEHYYGGKHNVYYRAGSWLKNGVARYIYRNSSPSHGVILMIGNEDSPAGEGLTIENYTVDGAAGSNYGSTGIDAHPNVSGSFGIVTYRNVTVTGNLEIGMAGMTSVQGGTSSGSVTNAVAIGCTANVSGLAAVGAFNLNVANGSCASGTVTISGATAGSIVVAGMTANISGSTIGEISSHTGVTNVISVSSSTLNGALRAYDLDAAVSLTSDNNTFVGLSSHIGKIVGVNAGLDMTRSQWQALGYDTHSTFN